MLFKNCNFNEPFKPPYDEGGGKTVGFDGGRENAYVIASSQFICLRLFCFAKLSLSVTIVTAAYCGGLPLSGGALITSSKFKLLFSTINNNLSYIGKL